MGRTLVDGCHAAAGRPKLLELEGELLLVLSQLGYVGFAVPGIRAHHTLPQDSQELIGIQLHLQKPIGKAVGMASKGVDLCQAPLKTGGP